MPEIETDKKMNGPIFRVLEKDDIKSVLNLMEEIKPNIGGSRDLSLYHALCHEALLDKRVVFIVGEEQSKKIAFYLAIIDRDRWRMSFMFRHPLMVTKMIFNRTFNRLRKLLKAAGPKMGNFKSDMPDISMYIKLGSSNKSWKDSSSRIAKLLYIAVSESHRGKSIAKEMWEYALKVLTDCGVIRVDTEILLNNIPSIRLHYGLGFYIYKQGGALFVTKDI